jgi:hypothetical protein
VRLVCCRSTIDCRSRRLCFQIGSELQDSLRRKRVDINDSHTHAIPFARNHRAMADQSSCPPLTRSSVQIAHQRIVTFVHRTPVATSETISNLASTPQSKRCSKTGTNKASEPAPHELGITEDATAYRAQPKVKLFFKCENLQKIGAFKARGAFHALGRLIEEEGIENVREKGVCTHSSGTLDAHQPCIVADG